MVQRSLTLLTDLYKLTVMQGYFKKEDANETMIFDAFYRSNPNSNEYSIYAELEQVIEYVKNLHFDKEDMDYLWTTGLFGEDFLDYLHHFKFTGDIYTIPESMVVFPREPLVEAITPIMEAQLMETAALDIINHQSLIATETARVIYAAQGDGVMEFGLRRAQGSDAGIYGTRTAMIAEYTGTSNVLAGQMFDTPVKGTHAHSWIMSFPDGLTVFRTHARLYLSAYILLVDTYDTLKSGVPNAIKVSNEMRETGIPLTFYGIRLDSGGLAYLPKKTKRVLDVAGFPDVVISASSDLGENLINSLKLQGATINPWSADTNLIASKGCPFFGGVYKLATVKDKKTGEFIPRIKLSENTKKIINPGNKTIQRVCNKEIGRVVTNLICLVDETYNSKDPLLLFDLVETWKETHLAPDNYILRELMVPVFKDGVCIYESPKVMELQVYCKSELATLWGESLRLGYPHRAHMDLSQPLWNIKDQLLDSYHFQG